MNQAIHSKKLVVYKPYHAAAKKLCGDKSPAIFLAGHQLAKPERYALYVCFAVIDQLKYILTFEETQDTKDSCGGGGDCDSCAVPSDTPIESITDKNRIAEVCSTDGSSCNTEEDGEGGGCCGGGNSPEQKMAVAISVLDYLFAGDQTGKPELDGFHEIAKYHNLTKAYFKQICEGIVKLHEVQRIVTWQSLYQIFWQFSGASLGLFHILGTGQINQKTILLAQAFGAGVQLTDTLCSLHDWQSSKFILPLDDLVKFKLSEFDVKRFAKNEADAAADDRWKSFVHFQVIRAQKLLIGGLKILDTLPPAHRRALSNYALIINQRLVRIKCHPELCFTPEKKLTWLANTRFLTRTVKLSNNSAYADMLI